MRRQSHKSTIVHMQGYVPPPALALLQSGIWYNWISTPMELLTDGIFVCFFREKGGEGERTVILPDVLAKFVCDCGMSCKQRL